MAKFFEVIRCPVCNRTYPGTFWVKIASVVKDILGYLMHSAGDHGMERVGELRLRRDVKPETLAIVKGRLLAALQLWLQKGWLSPDELAGTLNEVKSDKVAIWRVIYTYEGPGFRPVAATYGLVSVAKPLLPPLRKYTQEVKI